MPGESGLQNTLTPDQLSRKETSKQRSEKMGQVFYVGLCLLACFILGSSSTPVEGPQAKEELPLPGKSEESQENKIPAAANVVNSSQVAPRSTCAPGAYQYRENCYEYFPGQVTWMTAELQCQSLRQGSHLVSFSSLREEKMVSAFIRSRSPSTNDVWIGLSAAPEYNRLVWEWSDGSPYTAGAPLWDNRRPGTNVCSLECMLLHNIRYPTDSYRWAQQNCDISYAYMCKYRAWI